MKQEDESIAKLKNIVELHYNAHETVVDTCCIRRILQISNSKGENVFVKLEHSEGMMDHQFTTRISDISLSLDNRESPSFDEGIHVNEAWPTEQVGNYVLWQKTITAIMKDYESSLKFWKDNEDFYKSTLAKKPKYEKIKAILEEWFEENKCLFEDQPRDVYSKASEYITTQDIEKADSKKLLIIAGFVLSFLAGLLIGL